MDGDGGAAGFDNLAWVDSAGPVGRGHRKAPVPRGVACAVAPPYVQALTIGRCTGTMRTSCMGTLTTRTTCEVGMGHIIATGCFRSGVSGLVGTWLSLGSVGLWHSDADSAEPRAKRPDVSEARSSLLSALSCD
jgi:hypothetical protein